MADAPTAAPRTEADRLATLRSYAVLDTPPEPVFDRITELARLTFGAPMALISLLNDDRQWFKSRRGLDICETGRDVAFCDYALPLGQGQLLLVPDARLDPRFANNPFVTGEPGIRFYAGAVLISPEGDALGTLCVLDLEPRPQGATEVQRETLLALAELVMSELEVRRANRRNAGKRELLELAEAMSGVGRWRLDVATGAVEWSDEVFRIHGVERASFDLNLQDGLAFYESQDREKVAELLRHAVESRTGFAFQLHIRRPDGERRTVMSRATCELDAAREVVAVFGVFQDVTEQERLLEEVTAERERFRLLADNATDVISTYTLDGTITYVSPSIERLLGRTADTLIGGKTWAIIHPDDHAVVAADFQALVESGELSPRIESRLLKADGTAVWVESHPSPVRDAKGRLTGFQDVVRDISARKSALERAQDSETRYRLLAENANDMISVTGLDSTIQFVTPSVERVLGYTPEELTGRPTLELTHPDDRCEVEAKFTELVKGGPAMPSSPYQFRGRHKDGRWIWLEGQPRVQWSAKGRPLTFHDVVRDVSARKALEAELQAARCAAEAAAQAKADFLANMSHELRTPLTSIVGFTALAAEQPELLPATRDYVRRVQNASRALLGTVNDILDFSKLEAGQVTLHPAPTDVATLARDTIELFLPQAAAKDLVLRCEVAADLPSSVVIDGERLRQLVLNLVGNAVKFTEAGEVVLSLAHRDGRLRVEVRDTGCGILEEDQPRLFKRFSQVDGSSTRHHGGTGLGLAICKALSERMGGKIAVHSTPGHGSRFTLDLPATARVGLAAAPAPRPPTLGRLEALRVLVVDDHPANRELARLILSGAGAEAAEASDGREALALCASQPFDAVLLDMRMPDMDGAAVLRRLRAVEGPNDRTPVLAYTAGVGDGDDAAALLRAFDGVVFKPVEPAGLIAAVGRATAFDPAPWRSAHAG